MNEELIIEKLDVIREVLRNIQVQLKMSLIEKSVKNPSQINEILL